MNSLNKKKMLKYLKKSLRSSKKNTKNIFVRTKSSKGLKRKSQHSGGCGCGSIIA